MDYCNKNVLIYGLGLSGLAAVRRLIKIGAKPFVYIDNLDNCADNLGLKIISYKEAIKKIREDFFDLMVISPGVNKSSDICKTADHSNLKIIGELELGWDTFLGKTVAVTGTNGKTTTVTLLDKILKTGGVKSELVGNVGTPITSVFSDKNTIGVIEASSFQLESVDKFKPDVAVFLNLSPDHIDRHLSYENYINAKMNIFKNADANSVNVINADDKILKDLNILGKTFYFSVKERTNGAHLDGENIVFGKDNEYITGVRNLKIVGEHNISNALAAITAAKLLKVKNFAIEKAVSEFTGIPHRIEFVAELDGIKYYNDSKGTNINSTIVACNSMDGDTALILGGADKGYQFDELFLEIPKRVTICIAFGETAEKIVLAAKRNSYDNIFRAETLKECVLLARALIGKKGNVLLSPATSSFDMFKNYEERGEKFIEIVKSL